MFGKNPLKGPKDFPENDIIHLVNTEENSSTNNIFYTIQGEGMYAGKPAVFLRFSKCNLACSFCDTEFTNSIPYKIEDIISDVKTIIDTTPCNLVVITGGEPMIQKAIKPLIDQILTINNNIIVQIETAGVAFIELNYGFRLKIVCSPKVSTVHKKLIPLVDAFKFVVSTKTTSSDKFMGLPTTIDQGNPAVTIKLKPDSRDFITTINPERVYISPMDEYDPVQNQANLELVADICMKYGYTANLQMHKYLLVP